MIKMPQLLVDEGSVAEYMCETDSAYPNPAAVLWYLDDEPVDGREIHTDDRYPSHNGDRPMILSTLRLTAKREMNNRIVKCVLRNNSTKCHEHRLHVMCEYLLVNIYQKWNTCTFFAESILKHSFTSYFSLFTVLCHTWYLCIGQSLTCR